MKFLKWLLAKAGYPVEIQNLDANTNISYVEEEPWIIESPGTLLFEGTNYRITFSPFEEKGFAVTWDNKLIPEGLYTEFEDAEEAVNWHKDQVEFMGLTP